ncbi:hypothetical protein G9A89_016340 [Geosiphon pyriformis]|nr:hypothetical protein G9A89_016340 [Geosiphon pyriformis]
MPALLIKFKKEEKKPTWEAYQVSWTDENHNELPPILLWGSSTCCGDNKEYQMATKFYCYSCVIERFGRPKQVKKWDNELCLACGETLLDEKMWNDISEKGGTCNKSCQYTILISD